MRPAACRDEEPCTVDACSNGECDHIKSPLCSLTDVSVCPGDSDYLTTLRIRNTTACPKDYDYAVFQTSGPFVVVVPFGFGTVTVPAWQEVAVPIDLITADVPPPFDATATLQAEVLAAADPTDDYCSATASVRTPQTPGSFAELTDASTCGAESGATTVHSTLTLNNLTNCTRTFGYYTSTVSTEFYSGSIPE